MRTIRDFVFAADDNYSLQLKVAAAGLLHACRHNPSPLTLHILDLGLSEQTWENLKSCWTSVYPSGTFIRHVLDPEEFSSFRKWNGSLAPYARIKLPSLLPTVSWCLYADCDVLFLDDPEKLSACPKSGMALIGHLNPVSVTASQDEKWFAKQQLTISRETYICSGLMLINLDWHRKHEIETRCLEFLRKHPDSVSADQSALNFVCKGHIGLLPDGWGDFLFESLQNASPKCIHFAGTTPWNPQRHWTVFCGAHKFFGLWYWVASHVANEHGLKRRYLPLSQSFLYRLQASLLWPIVALSSIVRLYPRRFEALAQSIRNRLSARAINHATRLLEN